MNALVARQKQFTQKSPSGLMRKTYGRTAGMSGGLFDDIFGSVGNLVEGITDAIGDALTGVFDTIKQIGETIALIVRAAIGDVEWSKVFDSLGEVFQNIGNVLVIINPIRIGHQWLSESPLTAHAFAELDKFTGGMLTTAANISTLPWRAMRGDPISKEELIKDALFAIQVAAVVFAGPVALGVMIGTMVGREVCSKQTQAREACTAAFAIVGAAMASWGSAYTGVNWGTDYWASAEGISPGEQAAWLQGDTAYAQYLQNQAALSSTSFIPHLSTAAQSYLSQRGIDQVTQEAIALCQRSDWVGDRECEILGEVARNYVISDDDQTWDEFLAQEVARIGAEELMLQWFPEDSKEHAAIKRQWQIKYHDQIIEGPAQGFNPKALLLGAAAVATFLIGASA